MQQGKPIEDIDAVIYLDEITKHYTVEFKWFNHDIFTEVDVYLVRNDKSKMLITSAPTPGSPSWVMPNLPDGRIVVTPEQKYTIRYTFTEQEHLIPFNKKYPVFKFRIEMVGNPSVFAETNEFKVVLY